MRHSRSCLLLVTLGTTPTWSLVASPQPSYVRPRTYLRASAPNLESNDPFQVLGLNPSPSLDKKEIKRAYRKLALKYHPDVADEKDKQKASDQFAKINWAYETLSGKGSASSSKTTGGSSTSTSSEWTPPHRRSGPYSTSTSSRYNGPSDVSWEDFMPKYDDMDYDTGGDSFGQIFSDFVAGAVSGSGGFVKDLLLFLERDGTYTTAPEDDARLRILLRTGTLGEIGDEMDETELVVQQLTQKLENVDQEIRVKQADLVSVVRFSEKIALEEAVAELQSKQQVANKYLGKARRRLVSLQSRYKELIVSGRNDPKVGRRDSSWRNEPSSSRRTSSASTTSTPSSSSSTSTTSSKSTNYDTFGSFGGRGRGSSRRRAQRGQATTESQRTPRQETPSQPSQPYVPPHRQATSSWKEERDDKRRLRDLKVDEEFDKLKRDLGL